MKKTTRFLVLLSLCLCFIAVGVVTVFAVTQVRLQSSGEINFVANDSEIDATISAARLQGLKKQSGSGEMKGFSIKPGMSTETIENLAAFQSWNNISLEFTKESKGMGRILFNIKNNSQNPDKYLYVTFDYISDLSYEITATPSADFCIWPGDSHTFDIEFMVQTLQGLGYASEDYLGVDIFLSTMNPEDVGTAPTGMSFDYNDYDRVYLEDYTGTATTVNVPALVNMGGYICTVEEVYACFSDVRSTLKTVNLPRTIRSIGDYAFYECTALTGNINLPGGVEIIGEEAFYGVTNTGSIALPERLKQIYDMAFSHSKFSTVQLPTGLRYIGADAFWNCTNLKSVYFGEGLQYLQSGVFQGCTNLTGELKLPNTLKEIGSYCFSGCSKLTGTLVIPSSVSLIDDYAFSNCTGFTDLSLTEGLEWIGDSAFSNAVNITTNNLYFPSTLCYIGDSAFFDCELYGQIVLPEGLEELGANAFGCNQGITSVVLPSTLTFVGGDAFRETNLQEIITYAETPPDYDQGGLDCNNVYVADYLYDVYMNTWWKNKNLKKLSDYPR